MLRKNYVQYTFFFELPKTQLLSWKKENTLNTLEHTQTKLYPKWIVPVKQMVRSTQGLLKMGRTLAYVQS